jgi:phospholipase A1
MKRALTFTFAFFISSLAFADDPNSSTLMQKFDSFMNTITPTGDSQLQQKINLQKSILDNPLSLALYKPTYILPFYYTASPDRQIYENNTPENQPVMQTEFKSQISFFLPVFNNVFSDKNSIDISYTQLNYWQLYASSQYFRETNYEPQVFFQSNFHNNWLFRAGIDHQSNGRGGLYERSWNRAFTTLEVSGSNWLATITTWALIFPAESADLHNPNITYYLGHENVLYAHKIYDGTLSLEVQNLESGLRRGFIQTTFSYPIHNHISAYVQYFNGYGQSLIEYDHRTQAVGVGISFNDWI